MNNHFAINHMKNNWISYSPPVINLHPHIVPCSQDMNLINTWICFRTSDNIFVSHCVRQRFPKTNNGTSSEFFNPGQSLSPASIDRLIECRAPAHLFCFFVRNRTIWTYWSAFRRAVETFLAHIVHPQACRTFCNDDDSEWWRHNDVTSSIDWCGFWRCLGLRINHCFVGFCLVGLAILMHVNRNSQIARTYQGFYSWRANLKESLKSIYWAME